MPDGLEPLGVWDCNDAPAWGMIILEASEWATAHIKRARDTYRAEFYLYDEPFAVVYRYAVTDEGRKLAVDPVTLEIAREAPVVQVLGGLPPDHLMSR